MRVLAYGGTADLLIAFVVIPALLAGLLWWSIRPLRSKPVRVERYPKRSPLRSLERVVERTQIRTEGARRG